MKQIDSPAKIGLESLSSQCLGVYCPTITPVPDYARILEAVSTELIDICANKFFIACDKFGSIVGRINCPFDPVRIAQVEGLKVRIEELTTKVEELSRKR